MFHHELSFVLIPLTRLLLAGGMLLAGCSSGPPALSPPDINPQADGERAIELYDTSGDGALDEDELKATPPLMTVEEEIDEDGDGRLTAGEIADFLQTRFIDAGAGAVRLKCIVLMDGRPLPSAKVIFEPAAFFEEGVLKTATGQTDSRGSANISVSPDELANTRAGVLPGLYLIRVFKEEDGNEQVPERYNTESELGGEVASRASYMPGAMVLQLRSK